MGMDEYNFRVAGHLVRVRLPEVVAVERCLSNFTAFATVPQAGEYPLLSVELTDVPVPDDGWPKRLLSDEAIVWEESLRLEETDDNYFTRIQADDPVHAWTMVSSKSFERNVVYVPNVEWHRLAHFSSLVMIAFGQAALQHQTLLIHASVVKKADKGYLFLGKSGTGKSTHSRLWVKHIPDAVLLNDDCPAIRIYPHGEVAVFGTPWSGKVPCYKQEHAQVGAIVRLEQAPVNRMEWQQGKEALIALLPSCPAIRWNRPLFDRMVAALSEISTRIPIGLLRCLPDEHAANLCYHESMAKKVG